MKGLELSAKTATAGMIATVIAYAIGAASVPYSFFAGLTGGGVTAELLFGFSVKAIASVLPVYLLFSMGLKKILSFKFKKGCVFLLVAPLAVALANLPIVPQICGYMSINITFLNFIVYFLFCLSIGILEESLYRGIVLPLTMYKFGRDKRGLFLAILLSSALFGASHLVNLFGGNVGGVFLQVGYTFLIGCVCAYCTVVSGNIYPAIAVHTLFDLGGFLWNYGFATGKLWTAENVIFTVVVAVVAAIIMTISFIKNDFSEVYERWGLNVYPEKTGE